MTSSPSLKNEVDELGNFGDASSTTTKSNKKKRDSSTLRKAPQAPKRFKSSYILFFMAKQQEIKDSLGPSATVGDVSKKSSEMWKTLPPDQRAHWDDVAKKDKERYMAEKAMYTGPWQVPWKRAKKDPSAPKRPMSAFLYFSQDKRRKIKDANPGMRNTEVSRILGDMWKNASEEERTPHIEREASERAKYKVEIAEWRKEDGERKEAEKKVQQEQAKFQQARQPAPAPAPGPETPYYPPNSQTPNYSDAYNYSGYGPPHSRGPYSNYMNPYPPSQHQPPPHQGYYGYPPYPKQPEAESNHGYPPTYPPQDSGYGGYYEPNNPYPPQPMPQHYQGYDDSRGSYGDPSQPPPHHEQHSRYNDVQLRYEDGQAPPQYHHEHDHYTTH